MRAEFSEALAALARIDGINRLTVGGLRHDDVVEFIRTSTGERAALSRLSPATTESLQMAAVIGAHRSPLAEIDERYAHAVERAHLMRNAPMGFGKGQPLLERVTVIELGRGGAAPTET
jgi:hypothetical protein